MRTLETLAGRRAVVTGGGRGIGAAVAQALAEAGAEVLVAARTEEQIATVASNLRAQGYAAWPVRCDVADPDSVAALAAAAHERMGNVDILVNNAGIASSAPLHRQTLESWERIMAVNVTGTFLCTQAFAPGMVQRQWGRVVNVASLAARTGARYISAYAASKHAVLGFTRCIAAELADRGVTTNAVCPGYVDTDMTAHTVENIVSRTGFGRQEALAALTGPTPQHRLIEPEEVANVVLMLCHEAARGINGQAIGVDGGEFLG